MKHALLVGKAAAAACSFLLIGAYVWYRSAGASPADSAKPDETPARSLLPGSKSKALDFRYERGVVTSDQTPRAASTLTDNTQALLPGSEGGILFDGQPAERNSLIQVDPPPMNNAHPTPPPATWQASKAKTVLPSSKYIT